MGTVKAMVQMGRRKWSFEICLILLGVGFLSDSWAQESSIGKVDRILADFDGDGWCDVWASGFKVDTKGRSKSLDSDGDGLTDFEEMFLIRSPFVWEEIPQKENAATRAMLAKRREDQLLKAKAPF